MPAKKTTSSGEGKPFKLYDLVNNVPEREWFSFGDLLERFTLSVVLYYWCLLTRPIEFIRFAYLYNTNWYYYLPAVALTACFPIMPLLLMVWVCVEEVKKKWSANWMTGCPGACFYAQPDGFVHNLLWQWWLNIGMFSSVFLIIKDDAEGSRTTYQDTAATDKSFWFAKGRQCGARYPLKVCDWDGAKLKVHADLSKTPRIMIKLVDSYLGIGDKVVQMGEPPASGAEAEVTYFKDVDELEAIFRQEPAYQGVVATGTEFVMADKTFGVHQADCLTVRLPDGSVEVVRCMYWGNCTGQTSHSATSAYMVDWKNEKITKPARWYSPSFKSAPSDLEGHDFPGVKAACEKCIEMHSVMPELPWLNVIGWDTMSTGDGQPHIFFEGNFAGSRFRRHCFSSPAILLECIKLYAPFKPFGIPIVA
jgi:hypothetical protein